jgi:uncharacterized membrane protein YebE (DUF533 family)
MIEFPLQVRRREESRSICKEREHEMTKSALFLLGIGAGAAVVLIAKAARPLGAYAIAGGMLAYEAACSATEGPLDAIASSSEKIRNKLRRVL